LTPVSKNQSFLQQMPVIQLVRREREQRRKHEAC
jgi:hypothetical protein